MVTIHSDDELNSCALTEGILPSFDRLMKARPRRTAAYSAAALQSESRDQAATWLYATLARRIASGDREGLALDIEVWLLGPPTRRDARLANWFESQGPDYRVFILRQASAQWRGWTFDDIDSRLGLIHRSGPYAHLVSTGRAFINDVRSAYFAGQKAVTELVAASGHPYVFSGDLTS